MWVRIQIESMHCDWLFSLQSAIFYSVLDESRTQAIVSKMPFYDSSTYLKKKKLFVTFNANACIQQECVYWYLYEIEVWGWEKEKNCMTVVKYNSELNYSLFLFDTFNSVAVYNLFRLFFSNCLFFSVCIDISMHECTGCGKCTSHRKRIQYS